MILTHAVFDVPAGGVVVSRHPTLALAMAEAARLGGPSAGYVTGVAKEDGDQPKPAEPVKAAPAAVEHDEGASEGPGLFD